MSDAFDPYHIWLGIPPKDQPPTHYRLLGLAEFEENADVIDAAANRQTAYLHDMAAGPNRKESQRLLNEIAAARRCLLNSEKKKEYDAKLKAEAVASAPAPPPTAVPVAEAAPAFPFIDTGQGDTPGTPVIDTSTPAADGRSADPVASSPGVEASPVPATDSAKSETSTGRKIPRQWMFAGLSLAAIVIGAIVFMSLPDADGKSGTPTTTQLDGSGSGTTTVNDGNPDDDKSSDPEQPRSLFDELSGENSLFQAPSEFGGKALKK